MTGGLKFGDVIKISFKEDATNSLPSTLSMAGPSSLNLLPSLLGISLEFMWVGECTTCDSEKDWSIL